MSSAPNRAERVIIDSDEGMLSDCTNLTLRSCFGELISGVVPQLFLISSFSGMLAGVGSGGTMSV